MWIRCEINKDSPVNSAQVAYMLKTGDKDAGLFEIRFFFSGKDGHNIRWSYPNSEIRNKFFESICSEIDTKAIDPDYESPF